MKFYKMIAILIFMLFPIVVFWMGTGMAKKDNSILTPEEQLGKKLFFDKISAPDWVSCATCHAPLMLVLQVQYLVLISLEEFIEEQSLNALGIGNHQVQLMLLLVQFFTTLKMKDFLSVVISGMVEQLVRTSETQQLTKR